MRLVRRILERLSRNRILKRHLPARFGGGLIYVTPDAGLRFLRVGLGIADPWLLRMVSDLVRPGDVVWDVGANVGLFSLAAAFLAGPAGRVLALEPDAWLASLIHRSLAAGRQPRARVDVLPVAAADGFSVRRFHVAARARAASFLEGAGTDQAGGIRHSHGVLCVTLDSLLQVAPPPKLLKIDVEGAELSVLTGAAELLRVYKPWILCEIGKAAAPGVGRLLLDNGFILYDAEAPVGDRVPLETPSWNTLAVPRSDRDRMAVSSQGRGLRR